ncbi:MAG: hypothetical protein U5P41_11130 [Gammaproteobacteria bacterium]|nr:hypothetical protein [Gammaproteobacteria bacterium]
MSFQVTCMRALVTGQTGAFYRLCIRLSCLLAMLSIVAPAAAANIEQQRSQFLQARKAITAGQIDKFRTLAAGLENYPLYPYLRYEYIRRNLHSLSDNDIEAFFRRIPISREPRYLRNKWLDLLASRGRWQDYIDHYEQPNDNRLRCLYLIARMKTGQTEYLLEDIRTMWLVGYSQHDACDPAFAKLEASPLMTEELILDRLRLALENNETGLANYLGKKLQGETRTQATRWIRMHRDPAAGTRNPQVSDTPLGREIILHGIHRLARFNIDRALDRWAKLKDSYSFLPAERNRIERDLAVRAAGKDHPEAMQLLDRVANSEVDATVFIYRLRYAVNTDSWQKLRDWTASEPPDDVDSAQWHYWHARALEHMGQHDTARELYHKLAAERRLLRISGR